MTLDASIWKLLTAACGMTIAEVGRIRNAYKETAIGHVITHVEDELTYIKNLPFLIENRAEIGFSNPHFLHKCEKIMTCELLIKEGFLNPDAKNSKGQLPLEIALQKKNIPFARMLIEQGSTIDAQCWNLIRKLQDEYPNQELF
jgi:hypothetical protein